MTNFMLQIPRKKMEKEERGILLTKFCQLDCVKSSQIFYNIGTDLKRICGLFIIIAFNPFSATTFVAYKLYPSVKGLKKS